MNQINIIIVDDQTLMRDGLKTILDLEEDMEVIGVAQNGQEVLNMLQDKIPQVILMDIRMPIMNGVEATKRIKEQYPQVKILMLTTFQDEEYIIEALSNGADGYLLKDIQTDKLIQAIKEVHQGQLLITPEIARKLANHLKRQPTLNTKIEETFELSEREVEVVKLMVQGFSNKDIAKSLFISEGTVKNYISSIYSKLGTSDRTQAVLLLKDYQ